MKRSPYLYAQPIEWFLYHFDKLDKKNKVKFRNIICREWIYRHLRALSLYDLDRLVLEVIKRGK